MTYYTAVVILIIFSMITMITMVYNNNILSMNEKLKFMLTFSLIITASASEWLGVVLDGTNTPIFFHIAVKTLELSIAPILPLVCASAINSTPKPIVWGVAGINIFLEILSAFFGFIFYVDSSNVYYHGNFYLIYVLAYIICSIALFRETYNISKRSQNHNSQVLVLIMIYLVAGISMQFINSKNRIVWITVAISSILYYTYYSELIQQMDFLTTLLNRRSYEIRIGLVKKPTEILVLDIDNFKLINDRYGHAAGDKCLKEIGLLIKNIYGKYGLCYRTGGDEFCVIVSKELNKTDYLKQEFKDALAKLKQSTPYMPDVSIGSVRFDPAKDTIDKALLEADSHMYDEKQKTKLNLFS